MTDNLHIVLLTTLHHLLHHSFVFTVFSDGNKSCLIWVTSDCSWRRRQHEKVSFSFSQSSVGGKRNHRDQTCHRATQRGNEKLMDYSVRKREFLCYFVGLSENVCEYGAWKNCFRLAVYSGLWFRPSSHNYLLFIRGAGQVWCGADFLNKQEGRSKFKVHRWDV